MIKEKRTEPRKLVRQHQMYQHVDNESNRGEGRDKGGEKLFEK